MKRLRFLGGLVCLGVGLLTPSLHAQIPAEWNKPEEEIAEAWRLRKEVVSLGRDMLDKKGLDRLEEIQNTFGLSSMPNVSLALLHEIKERSDDPVDIQLNRLDYARKFSPSLSQVDYLSCSHHFAFKGIEEALHDCLEGVRKDLHQNSSRFVLFTNSIIILLTALCITFALFYIYLGVRYRRSATHQWAHHIRGCSPFGLTILSATAMILSWILLGWMGPPLLLTLLLWRYLQLSEKVVSTFALISFAALPLAYVPVAMHASYHQGIVPILEEPMMSSAFGERARKLELWLKEHPSDSQAMLGLALMEKNTGRFGQSRELLERATKISPTWSKPFVNLANIEYAEGKSPNAVSKLQTLLVSFPQSVVGHFNLAKIYFKDSRLDDGNQENKRAREADPMKFPTLDRQTNPNILRRFLADETLDLGELKSRTWELTPEVQQLQERFFASVFPVLPIPFFWMLIGFIFILSIATSWVWTVRRSPRSCEKCGAPSCAICDPIVEHEVLCAQCYHIFVRLEAIDVNARREKEKEIGRYRFFREIRERWITLVLPGLHQYFRGNFLRGLATLFCSAVFFLLVFSNDLLLRGLYSLPDLPAFPIGAIATMLLVLTYILAFVGALRR